MKKVAIVSCDKWLGRLEEDNNLKKALIDLGIDAKIISWQQPFDDRYDLLILRSVWGYQNYYNDFKNWIMYVKNNNIPLLNNPEMIINNIMKDTQFDILRKNEIELIKTYFLNKSEFYNENILDLLNDVPSVIKPTISGSGENTFLVNYVSDIYVPNMIKKEDIINLYRSILEYNNDCKIMIQPFISEINNGEYSCIFIGGELTHTMLRFPNIFHDKKRPYLVDDVPKKIINLAKKVEKIPEFKNYLYMRIDMVLVDGVAKIMEVELADPDLLTKYIEEETVKSNVIKTFAKTIERRVK